MRFSVILVSTVNVSSWIMGVRCFGTEDPVQNRVLPYVKCPLLDGQIPSKHMIFVQCWTNFEDLGPML